MQARDPHPRSALLCPDRNRQKGYVGRQVTAQKGIKQRLRLDYNEPGTGPRKGKAPIADMRANIERQIILRKDSSIEARELGDPPRPRSIDQKGPCEP